MAAPIVGENNIGIRRPWRSFQAAMSRSASSSTWTSVARLLALLSLRSHGADPPACGG